MSFLSQDTVTLNAQQNFLNGLNEYCGNLVYGNPSCVTLNQLLQQMSLLIMLNNPCGNLTNQEIECFTNLLNLTNC